MFSLVIAYYRLIKEQANKSRENDLPNPYSYFVFKFLNFVFILCYLLVSTLIFETEGVLGRSSAGGA